MVSYCESHFIPFLLVVCSTTLILFCAFQTMQLPLIKSELFTVLWDHITRDQHTRYFAPKNFSFLLDSWVTCTVVTVVIAAVLCCFLFMWLNQISLLYATNYLLCAICNVSLFHVQKKHYYRCKKKER